MLLLFSSIQLDTGRLLQITAAIKKPSTEESSMQPIAENESSKKEKTEKPASRYLSIDI